MDNIENIIPRNKNLLGLIISQYICDCMDENSIIITDNSNLMSIDNDEPLGVTAWIEPMANMDIVEEDSIAGLKEIEKISKLCKQLKISLTSDAIKNLDLAKELLEYYQNELNEYLENANG
tara:strand:- start:164 stop:526 length:363 start_codon:yes stop_codon:yes gene_type:complete